jgi:hypothetical protein
VHRDATQQLQDIVRQLLPGEVYQDRPSLPSLQQRRLARKNLLDIQVNARLHRDEFLQVHQETQIELGNLSKSKAIQQIRTAEKRQKCWNTIKQITKPKSQGGLSYVLTPVLDHNGQVIGRSRIFEKDQMDSTLHTRNEGHFAQADGTPLTRPPLSVDLQFDGCSPIAQEILNGNVPSYSDVHTTALLRELHRERPSISSCIDFQEMCYNFQKWKEQTTTSPSSKHLGIYKSLINAVRFNIQPDTEDTPILATRALEIQHMILNLAVRECHTLERWQTVHNFFLEKLPGNPLIEKLRVIHIYEADWNFLNRYFAAYKVSKLASREGTTTVEQGGGRPGRSSAEVATNTVLTYEIIRLQRLSGGVMYNDAKACFDRIVENIANMALLREGYPIEMARLHAQTLQRMKYFIKHKLGIGSTPNQHTSATPFLGSGQGATDSPARWSFISDALIRAYKKMAHPARLKSPSSSTYIDQQIQAFVDDTRTLFLLPDNTVSVLLHQLLDILNQDSCTWDKLLHAASAKLEGSKCKFGLFQWQFDSTGEPSLIPGNQLELQVPSSEDNQQYTVTQLSPSESYKYLGLHIAMDGNMHSQEHALQQLCDKFITVFSQTSFDMVDINQCYTTVFAPAIKYVLPGTSLDSAFLINIQKPILLLVLPKLGFNQHMPREVVLAPLHFGGLGLMDLVVEQGLAQTLFVIGQLRASSPSENTILVLLETYQVSSGSPDNPFVNTQQHGYISAPWVQSLQQFLHKCNAQIHIPRLHRLHPMRRNDQFIMTYANSLGLPTADLMSINRCRLFLQVMSLSEITNDNGTHILQHCLEGAVTDTGQPQLSLMSSSTLAWPAQPRPDATSWRAWKRLLYTLVTSSSSLALLTPLGPWLLPYSRHRTWHYGFDPVTKEVIHTTTETTRRYVLDSTKTRNTHRYVYTAALGPSHQLFPLTPLQFDFHQVTISSQRGALHTAPCPAPNPPVAFQCLELHNDAMQLLSSATAITVPSDGGLL